MSVIDRIIFDSSFFFSRFYRFFHSLFSRFSPFPPPQADLDSEKQSRAVAETNLRNLQKHSEDQRVELEKKKEQIANELQKV